MNDTLQALREQVINSFELLIWLLFALLAIGGTFAGLYSMFTVGIFSGLFLIIFSILSAILSAGSLFLLIGIHDNSRRTAEALELMSQQR